MENFQADSLRQEHAELYGALAELKRAEVNDGPPAWQTLRDVCMRLSSDLGAHMRREEQLLGTPHRSLGAAASKAVLEPSSDHYSDYRFLQVITHYIILESRPFLLNNRYQLLKDFLRGLHIHMDEQETKMFPILAPEETYAGATVL